MSVKRSAEWGRGSWTSALVLAGGLLLTIWSVRRPFGAGSLLALFGLGVLVWGWREGGLRWWLARPGAISAFLIGGGNPLARRYEARLTKEAVVYSLFMMVLLLGSLLGHSNMLLLVFALMAGAFVLNGQATMTVIRRTRARRFLPEMVFAGEPCAIRIELANRKRWMASWMVLVEDTVQFGSQRLHPTVLFQRVPARSDREASYQLTPTQRGAMEFLPLRIASRYPLGLWERGFEIDIQQRILVLPRIGRLTAQFDRWLRSNQRSQFEAPARSGVFDEEFHRLREFRPGDSRRAIHWRTTARRNELMVREYQERHSPELVLLIDLWLPDAPGPDQRALVESVVSFAATCCVTRARVSMDTGIQLIICGGNGITLGEARFGLQLREALEALAVAAGARQPDWQAARGAIPPRRGDPSRKLLVTTHPAGAERLRQLPAADEEDLRGLIAEFEVLGGATAPLEDFFQLDFYARNEK